MKQFSIEEYLKNPSRKVVTRDGRNVKIHCTNYYSCYSVIAEIEGSRFSNSFYPDGKFRALKDPSPNDLFFAPEKKEKKEKHEGWINLYRGRDMEITSFGPKLYTSREEAEKEGKTNSYYVATAKMEWEE